MSKALKHRKGCMTFMVETASMTKKRKEKGK
jgi:hypothetical protein